MRYVVGYVPNQRGRDAINLAAALAGPRAVNLDIVVVLPVETPTYDMYVPDSAYHSYLDTQGREWLDTALTDLPNGVHATSRIRRADSITEGLIDASTDPSLGAEAGLIIVGASHRGLQGRFTVGSVAAALLHSSPVPVALAPAGYDSHPALTRITCATGTRPGAELLLDVAVDAAATQQVPLRLMSLVALGTHKPDDQQAMINLAERHEADLVNKAVQALPDDYPVTSVVGRGQTFEEAAQALSFDPGEIVLVGSSRLAGPRRLFIGASTNKMLRALPVPMIVVPRDYHLPTSAEHDVPGNGSGKTTN
jgi:nucleotide-binding universal stress UspA family protein